jgi:hypothetical protein
LFINDFCFLEKKIVCGASQGSAGCFKKATETPNAGHDDIPFKRVLSF